MARTMIAPPPREIGHETSISFYVSSISCNRRVSYARVPGPGPVQDGSGPNVDRVLDSTREVLNLTTLQRPASEQSISYAWVTSCHAVAIRSMSSSGWRHDARQVRPKPTSEPNDIVGSKNAASVQYFKPTLVETCDSVVCVPRSTLTKRTSLAEQAARCNASPATA